MVVRPQLAWQECVIVLLFPIDSQNVFDFYFLVLKIKIRFQVENLTIHSLPYHLKRKYRVDVNGGGAGGEGGG